MKQYLKFVSLFVFLPLLAYAADTVTFTQGDTPLLQLTAESGEGIPIDIDGATFTTQLKGPVGALVTLPNSQHVIVEASLGRFNIQVQASQGLATSAGSNKDIVTKIEQGPTVTYVHGTGILTVLPNVPIQ